MSDSVQPHRQQPTRLHHPWDSPGKSAGVGCHCLLQCMKVTSLSCVRLFETPCTAAYQAPLMGFSRQEYWSGLLLPSPMHESDITQSCPTLCDPMDCSTPGSSCPILSMGFSRQEYWSGLPLPSPPWEESILKTSDITFQQIFAYSKLFFQ